jgi:hypothetical protein
MFQIPDAKQYCGQNKVSSVIQQHASADADGQHIVAYSISQGSVVNVVAFATELDKEGTDYGAEWVTNCTKDEMLQVCCYSTGGRNSQKFSVSRAGSPRRWRYLRLGVQNSTEQEIDRITAHRQPDQVGDSSSAGITVFRCGSGGFIG